MLHVGRATLQDLGEAAFLDLQERCLDQRQPFGFLQDIPRAAVSEGGEWRHQPLLQPSLGVEAFRIARLHHDLLDQVRQNWWGTYVVGVGHAAFWSRAPALATLGLGLSVKTSARVFAYHARVR